MSQDQARKVLLEKKQELELRIKKIEGDLKKGHSRDWEEQAQERENDDVLDALAVEAEAELKRVQQALNRVDNNTYGTCTQCGAEINAERLQAVPDAEHCVNCA